MFETNVFFFEDNTLVLWQESMNTWFIDMKFK